VRSCETFVGDAVQPLGSATAEFPDPPELEKQGTDPARIINYCYETLYQSELNGNANGAAGRALAKRYGAYQLAVELLELLSADDDIGVPHLHLRTERRAEFMRECGFALLDIGNLAKAKACFDRAERELGGQGREIDRINAILDSCLADSAAGDVEEARASLERAREAITQLHRLYVDDEVLAEDFRLLRKAQRRFLTREAHLAYLTDDNDLALDLLDKIENEKRWAHAKEGPNYSRAELVPSFAQRLEAEQTHLLVSALQKGDAAEDRCKDNSASTLALNRCLDAMLLAHSEGLNHQAMGFRIALARCFRRRGMLLTAETMLDAVHRDLLRYGCSERTFLSFLNEAGRTLCGLGDPIRAYATYLRPAIGRAKAHGFMRDAEQAATQALKALVDIRRLCEQCLASEAPNGKLWRHGLEAAKAKHRELVVSVEDVAQDDLFGRDPLFAYAIANAERVIDELASCEDIDRHIAEIQAEVAGLQH
jgi:tetratricopeptide (TPR) repeat protein